MSEAGSGEPPALQVRISSGPVTRRFLPAGVKLSTVEKKVLADAFAAAKTRALGGDDADLRALSTARYAVECVSDIGQTLGVLRRRKFSDPLFLTPAGLLRGFPETDLELFADLDLAEAALRLAKVDSGQWEIRQTTLATELAGKRYTRWAKEVKGKPYSEPRRTPEELAAVFAVGGLPALMKLYSKAHAFKIAKRLQANSASGSLLP